MFRVAYHPSFCHPVPETHRFPMRKYECLPEQLLYLNILSEADFFEPNLMDDKDILLAHSYKYLTALNELALQQSEIRKIGFALTRELVEREKRIVQGTWECCMHAVQNQVSFNIAGGTHHAFHDHGEGFCLLNDLAISALKLQKEKICKQVLIIDLDVHQGNGTASILKDCEGIFTFSMHGQKNYPLKKEKSNLDIELEDNTGDEEYLSLLDKALTKIKDQVRPDFLLYQSGVDILNSDALGRLSVSSSGCEQRDRLVMEAAKNWCIPLVAVMGGGYSPTLSVILDAHCNTFRVARETFF